MVRENLLKAVRAELGKTLQNDIKTTLGRSLGKNMQEITGKISAQIKSELGKNIWNAINGQRILAEIGTLVKRKPEVVLK